MASQAPSIPRVGIIGSGSWATALTFLFTQHEEAATHPVHWWIRQPEALDHIRKTGHNPHYLQSLTLDRDRLALHGDVQAVVDASDLVVLCVPSAYLDDALQGVTGLDGKVVFNAIKGFITDDHHIPARYLHKVFGVPYDRIGLISGPSHAEEVARKNWTYLTLACPDVPLAERWPTGSAILGCAPKPPTTSSASSSPPCSRTSTPSPPASPTASASATTSSP